MIVFKYCGGLGNQMYQYAMQIALEQKYTSQTFKIDTSHYRLFKEHNGFELDSYFNIEFSFATDDEIKSVYNGLVPSKWMGKLPFGIRDFIVHKLQWKYLGVRNKIYKKKSLLNINDENYPFMQDKLYTGNWYVNGMWQDYKHFNQCRDAVISKFTMNPKLSDVDVSYLQSLMDGEGIAVHVRGGDFLKASTQFNLCGVDYYKKGLEQLPELPLYVFTDDIEYAKSIFNDKVVRGFISHSSDQSVVDMYMLSKAKYLLLSNSTFAFWGAYLNKNAKAVV